MDALDGMNLDEEKIAVWWACDVEKVDTKEINTAYGNSLVLEAQKTIIIPFS